MPYKRNGVWHTTKAEKESGMEYCVVDGTEIKTMTYKGTGVCSDRCRKARDGNDPEVARH